MRESKRDFILGVVGLIVGAIGVPFFLAGRQMREAAVLAATQFAPPNEALLRESRMLAGIGIACFIIGGIILIVAIVRFLLDRIRRKKQEANENTAAVERAVETADNALAVIERIEAQPHPDDPMRGAALALGSVLSSPASDIEVDHRSQNGPIRVSRDPRWPAPRWGIVLQVSNCSEDTVRGAHVRLFQVMYDLPSDEQMNLTTAHGGTLLPADLEWLDGGTKLDIAAGDTRSVRFVQMHGPPDGEFSLQTPAPLSLPVGDYFVELRVFAEGIPYVDYHIRIIRDGEGGVMLKRDTTG